MSTLGYLRETREQANKAGLDPITHVQRSGLEDYLDVIFPEVSDWLHDKTLGEYNGIKYRIRPDYRSESLKLIIEFDGLPHYQKPDVIMKDKTNTSIYESCGYKVVRIPYFIQLSSAAVRELFNRDVESSLLFDESLPSLNIEDRCTPAYLCPMGIERMKQDFERFPKQREVNINYLLSLNQSDLTGVDYLLNTQNKR